MGLTVGAGSSNIYRDKTNDDEYSSFKTMLKVCSPVTIAIAEPLFEMERDSNFSGIRTAAKVLCPSIGVASVLADKEDNSGLKTAAKILCPGLGLISSIFS